jgi:hypothetical protein
MPQKQPEGHYPKSVEDNQEEEGRRGIVRGDSEGKK